MANITTYLENKLLTQSAGVTPAAWHTNTKIALFITSPSASYVSGSPGSSVEVGSTDAGYGRQTVTWGTAANGQIKNSASITWTSTIGPWNSTTAAVTAATITSIGIFEGSTNNLLWFGPLSASVKINTGDTFTINTNSLILSLS